MSTSAPKWSTFTAAFVSSLQPKFVKTGLCRLPTRAPRLSNLRGSSRGRASSPAGFSGKGCRQLLEGQRLLCHCAQGSPNQLSMAISTGIPQSAGRCLMISSRASPYLTSHPRSVNVGSRSVGPLVLRAVCCCHSSFFFGSSPKHS